MLCLLPLCINLVNCSEVGPCSRPLLVPQISWPDRQLKSILWLSSVKNKISHSSGLRAAPVVQGIRICSLAAGSPCLRSLPNTLHRIVQFLLSSGTTAHMLPSPSGPNLYRSLEGQGKASLLLLFLLTLLVACFRAGKQTAKARRKREEAVQEAWGRTSGTVARI